MTDYMVSVNEARDLLDGYETLKSSPECSGACARAAAPELARTVVALHERVAAVEAERDGALAHAEELTQALRATQRDAAAADIAHDECLLGVEVAVALLGGGGDDPDVMRRLHAAARRVLAERDALRKLAGGGQ